jgi:hypothetical protein
MVEVDFSPDFLFSTILDVHFGSGPFAILYASNGGVGNPNGPFNFTFNLSDVNIQGAPFSLLQPVIPGGTFTINNGPTGAGTATLTTNAWQREAVSFTNSARAGHTPSDTIAKNAGSAAWLGQMVTDGQFSQGPAGGGGGTCFFNIDGYLVFDLSQFTSNISFNVVAASQVKTMIFGLATWKDNLKKTVLSTSGNTADQVQVTGSKGWVDQFLDYSLGNLGPPQHAVDFATANGGSGQSTNLAATINIKTLKVSLH